MLNVSPARKGWVGWSKFERRRRGTLITRMVGAAPPALTSIAIYPALPGWAHVWLPGLRPSHLRIPNGVALLATQKLQSPAEGGRNHGIMNMESFLLEHICLHDPLPFFHVDHAVNLDIFQFIYMPAGPPDLQ